MSGQENMMNMMTKQQEYKLFVGDLDENCNDTILRQNFSQYGASSAMINKAKRKRYATEVQERFYGIVTLPSMEECERAKNEMDQQIIMNNRIRVCIFRSYFDRINSDIHFKGTGTLNPQEIRDAFSQYGKVFSVKIAQEKNGQQLNYGYLSFIDKESRDKCISALSGKALDIKGFKVEVNQFLPYNQREKNFTNIYVKNLPGKSDQWNEESVKTALQKEAQKYGEVLSTLVKYDEKHQKHFGFICFKSSESAKTACKQLSEWEIDGQKVEVNWAMKKEDRHQYNLQNFKMNPIKTNIYLKNLLETVDEDQVKEAFQQFGTITSVAVRFPGNTPNNLQNKTKHGFVNFKTEQMAQSAVNSPSSAGVQIDNMKALFLNGVPSMCFHKSKELINRQKSNRNNMSPQNIMQMIQQMSSQPHLFLNAMQSMMMMNMNMMMKGGPRNNFQRNNMNMMNMPKQMPNMQAMMGMPRSMPQMAQMPQFGMNQFGMNQMGVMAQMQQMPMFANNNKIPNQPPQQKVQVQEQQMTAQQLKENLNEFLKYDQEKQRALLGSLLFPLVEKVSDETSLAPKITGMLIDFEVFEVSEILEFLENEELLKERIKEAEDLILSNNENK